MPLFDFRCKSCEQIFELRLSSRETGQCPNCQSSDLERLPSLFGIAKGGKAKPKAESANSESPAAPSHAHSHAPNPSPAGATCQSDYVKNLLKKHRG